MKKIKWILLILAFVLSLAGCATNTKNKNTPTAEQHSPTTDDTPRWVQNFRFGDQMKFCSSVIEMDEYIYYLSQTGVNLYYKSTNVNEQLITDDAVKGLYQYEDEVYFFTPDQIRKFVADGTVSDVWNVSELTEGVAFGDEIYEFFLHQNKLYVMDSTISAIQIDLTTNKAEEFLNDFESLAMIGDKCYYVDHAERTFSIYEFDLVTRNKKLLRGDGQYKPNAQLYSSVRAVNDILFYSTLDPTVIYQYDLQGQDRQIAEALDYYAFVGYTTDTCFYYTTVQEDGSAQIYEYDTLTAKSNLVAEFEDWYPDLIMTRSFIVYRENEDAVTQYRSY